jgi:hypothetical protein
VVEVVDDVLVVVVAGGCGREPDPVVRPIFPAAFRSIRTRRNAPI